MTYEEFKKFVEKECFYETVYKDSEGVDVLVIRLLDAYHMLNKATGRLRPHGWVGLTQREIIDLRNMINWMTDWSYGTFAYAIEQKLKEKNRG